MGISTENDRLTIILSKELKNKIQALAEKDKRSMSNYIAALLEKHVKENQ